MTDSRIILLAVYCLLLSDMAKKARTKKRSVKHSKKRVVKKLAKKKVAKKKPVRKKPIKKRKSAKKVVRKKPVKRVVKPKKRKMVKKKPAKRIVKRKPVRKVAKSVAKSKKKVTKKRAAKRKPKKRVIKRKKTTKKPTKKPKKRVIKKRRIAKKPVKKRIKKRKPRKRKKTKIVRRVYSGGGPLEQLFESPVKVQIMKLFFRNPEESFLLKEATKIMRQNLARVRQEIKRLEKIGLLRAKQISPRKQLFSVNPNFDFFNELRELILRSSPVSKDKMLKAIRGLGKIKLVLLSGLFIDNDSARMGQGMSRADLLIVGDNINQRRLAGFIKNLEAEAGTDINCVVMNTEEFNYRYDMYDRFVRDLLSEKCEFLINRLGL